jgi:hypothetical protein
MTGGDFYSMTEPQLEKLLAGELDYTTFLYDEGNEKPHECFSRSEHLWYELTQLLEEEGGCGTTPTDAIPEAAVWSTPDEVAATAVALDALQQDELVDRCETLGIEASPELLQTVEGLTAFYRRAADAGMAVLFRVT